MQCLLQYLSQTRHYHEPDEEGFLYPEINQSLCVACGRCTAICPLLCEGNYKEGSTPRFYVARHKSQEVLRQSTSGGAFTGISDAILRQNGVIYGADYDEAFRVLHQRAETPEQRDRMWISKYVQSDMRDTYAQIKADLKDDPNGSFHRNPLPGRRAAWIYGKYTAFRQFVYLRFNLPQYSKPTNLGRV